MFSYNKTDTFYNPVGNQLIVFILIWIFAVAGTMDLKAEDPALLRKYLRKSTSWEFKSLNMEVPVNIYYITRSTHSRPWNIGSPVFVYIKNLGEERIGTEPDSIILMDYLAELWY